MNHVASVLLVVVLASVDVSAAQGRAMQSGPRRPDAAPGLSAATAIFVDPIEGSPFDSPQTYRSDRGDYLVASYDGSLLTVAAHPELGPEVRVKIGAPVGQTLSPGSYVVSAGGYRLDVNGRPCSSFASFTVHEASFSANNEVLAFAASYEDPCSATFGEVRVNSAYPMPAYEWRKPDGTYSLGFARVVSPHVGAYGTASLDVLNTGTAPLDVAPAIEIAGEGYEDFDVADNSCADPTLAPGTTCRITFRLHQLVTRYGSVDARMGISTWRGELRIPLEGWIGDDVVRDSGPNRFATAATLSRLTHLPGVSRVFIATGANFPDALSGGVPAAMSGSPMLLVGTTLPTETREELRRLQPESIVVLGSAGVVSDAVFSELDSYTSGPVLRVAGPNRFATAAAVSQRYWPTGADTVFIATGLNFPDALAAVPAAAKSAGPILLVNSGIPPATAQELRRLAPQTIVVLGSPGVVSESVKASLQGFADGSVIRLAGSDRYGTAAAITDFFFEPYQFAAGGPVGMPAGYVVGGATFPDALAAGSVAGWIEMPVFLVAANAIPAATQSVMRDLHPYSCVIVGGPSVVSEAVADQLQVECLEE